MRENNFNSLFGDIWIELHLPLIGPFLNCLKVPDEFRMSNINAVNSSKKGGIIGEKFDIGRNIVSKIIDVN